MSFKAGETYPLPPPSTVSGFLHNLLGATEYIPMRLSIQGTYESITNNLQTLYKFGKRRKDRTYWAVVGNTSIQHNVFYSNLLVQVNLTIHIGASCEILNRLHEALLLPKEYPALGRWEDLVRIEKVFLVTVEEKEDSWNGIPIKSPIYIPRQEAINNNLQGINYRLNSFYEVIDGFKKWEMVEMFYVESGKIYNKVLVDTEGDIVFWHKNKL